MANVWCPYTGQTFPAGSPELSVEHVIPVSCGGHHSLTIPVCAKANSELGSVLEGYFAQHPLVAMARKHFGLRGRSGIPPIVEWPAVMHGLRGDLDLTKEKIEFRSFRNHAPFGLNVVRATSPNDKFLVEFNVDLHLVLRMGCKLALASACFLFPEAFRDFGYHEQLRHLMESEAALDQAKFMLANNNGKGFWALSWPKSLLASKVFGEWVDAVSRRRDKNVIFTFHTVSEVVLGISLFSGLFRWFFNIAKDSGGFPIGGDFELGVAIEVDLVTRQTTRTDMRSYLIERLQDQPHA